MKQTGVIRKIDELGRIVLPKEIRRNLGIKNGENLEIFVDGKGVYLQKYSKLVDLQELEVTLSQLILDIFGINVIFLDREKIVVTTLQQPLMGKELKKITPLIENREGYESTYEDTYFGKKGYFLMKPIIVSTDVLGMFIFYKEEKFQEWERKLSHFIVSLLAIKIDI